MISFSSGCRKPLDAVNLQQEDTIEEKREIIVKKNLSDSSSAKSTISSKLYAVSKKVKNLKSLGVEVINVPAGVSYKDTLRELRNDPNVEYAEPNYRRKMALADEVLENDQSNSKEQLAQTLSTNKSSILSAATVFNDPDIKLQYGLDNMEAEKAWKITQGSESVVIAVVDTGADYNHPDLKDNLVQGFTTVSGTTLPIDDNGHGTHVSGIIVALSNNEKGGVGIAPKCKVMPIKALSAKGEGTDSDIAEGIIWAVDHGAKIISMSLGGPEEGKTLENAMKYAYNSNVLMVAAMGNNGKKMKNYPASYKNVIAVGATNQKNEVASFSNFGEWISVSAPGFKIYSTFPSYKVDLSKLNLPPNYAVLSGTSMATPFVSGVAGLILSKNPNLNRSEVRKKIEKSCLDIDKKGFDENSGYGVVSAFKALAQ